MAKTAREEAQKIIADNRKAHHDYHLVETFEAGIALHIGEVMYGNVGSDERLDFTVIGRAVNEAARLEALTKELGRPVLASASFAAPIRDRFAFAGAHLVPGFKEKFETYVPRD